ncbi:ERGIC and golgi family 3 [Strigomonas culicis]|uniref:ERGIC and golgi family 3 n=1 Tax=Strigomonas culicis TaxID=28005 RepID=S9V4B8_9TRYP|nr:ERGIC and golgi family 3 [Strigomonas culicis]|eukprot:EPY35894.1 ERGIC and golgi family 3 [Strigomonas culicis]
MPWRTLFFFRTTMMCVENSWLWRFAFWVTRTLYVFPWLAPARFLLPLSLLSRHSLIHHAARAPVVAMLRKVDVFPKFDRRFEQDARQRTVGGGVLSLLSMVIILVLVVGELRYFFTVEEHHEMVVDTDVGGDMLITANVTFPRVPCDLIALDVVDVFGVYADNVAARTVKTRVDSETLRPISRAREIVDEKKIMTKAVDEHGAEKENCPSCYGAEMHPGDCCHTCDEVRRAYGRKGWQFNPDDISVEQCAEERIEMAALASSREGCGIYAQLPVSRVTGSIHFIPGRAYTSVGGGRDMHVLDRVRRLNLSHIVHTLEFGAWFPGQLNPLDGHAAIRPAGEVANGLFSYAVKIVPVRFHRYSALLEAAAQVVASNQYSVTQHFTPTKAAERSEDGQPRQQHLFPGVFLSYDLSPIRIELYERRPYPSVIHFLLQLCAVCGGVWTVAGIVDSFFFQSARKLQKIRQGKQI